jgi:transposase
MAQFDLHDHVLVGPGGRLPVPAEDEISHKLLMLVEGECEDLGPLQAARKFGFSKQRYFQLRAAFNERGATALCSQKRGPKRNYRRTSELVRQVIRHRFLDPDASAEVITQKLVQCGLTISIRSVQRVLTDYGLQKKTPQVPPTPGKRTGRGADHAARGSGRRQRSGQHRTRRPPATGR